MPIDTLVPVPVLPVPRPRAERRRLPLGRVRPGPPSDSGLVALTLGLLALTSSVHPLWALLSIAFAVAGGGAALRALPRRGERRAAAVGLAAAVLALAVASVTVPAFLDGAGRLLAWVAGLRAEGP